jgi:Alw26I/Eco31I/Esp3I family type II restriction m6 adenine DNA methyltransferase
VTVKGVEGTAASNRLLEAFGLGGKSARLISFAFSSKVVPAEWKAYSFDLEWEFYYVVAPGATLSQIRALASGISKENFGLVAVCGDEVFLALRRSKKDDNGPLLIPLRKEDDFEKVIGAVNKFNFVSDVLTAHSSLSSLVDLLKAGAERHFVNRGLFSNYFLKERLSDCLSKRGRSPSKEGSGLLGKLGGEFPIGVDSVDRVLDVLGYSVEKAVFDVNLRYPEYKLRSHGRLLDVCCVVADVESLDVKTGNRAAPSYQAVSALKGYGWVILTNGRLWRLYSSKVASASTNYFEVDLENVAAETDQRLVYFTSLFSASAFLVHDGAADVDLVYDEGIRHAHGVEDDLRRKVFDGDLFVNLVKSVLNHSSSKVYSQEELDAAKALALKLLYRLLFVLYAESRKLLPVDNAKYKQFALESLPSKLDAFEKKPDETSVWKILKQLFEMISLGDVDANLPQYDGDLFAKDPTLDGLAVKNRFIVPALRDLMQTDGRGIDYQNLGVRHLGSLYEALLEYSVRQAQQSLVMYKDEILDAKFADDMKQKPLGFIKKGDLYLSAKGLARKGSGSYYTPDEIVTFLVKKGLEPHFKAREEQFKADLQLLPPVGKPRDLELEKKCTDDLLGLRVVDPAMGSGHFLVAVVNEITRWVIDLLHEYPNAPLMNEIEEFRRGIIESQRKKGIRLDEDLLTDTVILKRMVMKRCVYGVDINPLAVELAKVSLWLDSFTIGTPLTFLNHHIRPGDSLIGLWLANIAPKVFETTLEKWTGTLERAGENLVEAVVMPADLTVEEVTLSQEAYEAVRAKTKSFSIMLDMFCASIIDPELGKRLPNNLSLIEETSKAKGRKPSWWIYIEETCRLSEKYGFFHWELEFPDAFNSQRKGFDLVVMNPPWDAVKPEDDDFFSVYYPKFRRIKSKPEKQKIMKTILKDAKIAQAYEEYRKKIEDKVNFFKQSKEYVLRGSGDTNLWKLFLERALKLASEKGSFSIVIPSGIVTDEGGKQLREALFRGRIRLLYEFENKNGIFPDVHRSYKFALLVADKAQPAKSFPAAFYLHEVEALEGKTEKQKFVDIPVNLIRVSAPESLSIPEVRNKQQLDVFLWLYQNSPLLSDKEKGWSISLISELHRTNDSDLFRSDGKGWPLVEGKHFHQFLPCYEKTLFTVDPSDGLKRTAKHREYYGVNEEVHKNPRLAFRNVASSTNIRSMMACILPPRCFSPHSVAIVLPKSNEKVLTGRRYLEVISHLSGILNSMIFDFLLRTRNSMNVSFFYVYQTPVPLSIDNSYAKQIQRISARLSSIDDRFKEFAALMGVECGPLTIKEYVELTAKLNALVAKHYGLNREQLEVILQSFEGFEEDKELVNLKEVVWSDAFIRKFNGEVRKRVLPYFDQLTAEESGVKN